MIDVRGNELWYQGWRIGYLLDTIPESIRFEVTKLMETDIEVERSSAYQDGYDDGMEEYK